MVERIFGQNPVGIGKTWTTDTAYIFNKDEQGYLDEHAYSFLAKYDSDELVKADIINVIATDPMMPFTTLTMSEQIRINTILTHISGGSWDEYVSEYEPDETYVSRVARWAGEEWLL